MQKHALKRNTIRNDAQTPPYALEPILPFLERVVKGGIIWEPACGEGLLANALRNHGFRVTGTDIKDEHDFLSMDIGNFSAVVTNPPHSNPLKYQFLERCYELGKPFALLIPVETIGAARAQRLFQKHGAEWIFLDKRVDFKMPNKGWAGTAWMPTFWTTWGLNVGQPVSYAVLHKNGRKHD